MRLIDADKLIIMLDAELRDISDYLNIHEKIKDIIDNAPTVSNWGKWVISEIQCPNCFEYFQTDCYSMGELNKCPYCEAKMINEEETS